MIEKKIRYHVVLAVMFENWDIELEETRNGMTSSIDKIEYPVDIASSNITEAATRAKEAFATELTGQRVARISVLSVNEEGAIFV